MLSFERHLVVVLVIATIIIAIAIGAAVFEIPLPFLGSRG